MDVTLFPDRKTVDDFVIHDANVLLVRSGVSRFRLRAESRTEAIHIEISSAQALTVDCDEPVPTWAFMRRAVHDAFAVVRVRNVMAHLEHMDRGLYWLGVGRTELWAMRFRASGRVASRILASSPIRTSGALSPGRLCDLCGAFVPEFPDSEGVRRARRAANGQQPSIAAAELVVATGCSGADAELWTRHAGRARSSVPGPPCPFCHHPLPTSRSQQCLQCKADWHEVSSTGDLLA